MSAQQIPLAEPLVEVERGSITESRHRGHIVVVDPEGNIITSLGAPEYVTYLRSSAKPFQAMPLLTTGAAEHFEHNRHIIEHHADIRMARLAGLCGERGCCEVWVFQSVDGVDAFTPVEL